MSLGKQFQSVEDGINQVRQSLLVGCTCTLIEEGFCRCCLALRCIEAWWDAAVAIARWEWYDSAEEVALQFYQDALLKGTNK